MSDVPRRALGRTGITFLHNSWDYGALVLPEGPPCAAVAR